MKNKEKYAKEIIDITCDGNDVAVCKSTGKPIDCCDIECDLSWFFSPFVPCLIGACRAVPTDARRRFDYLYS